MSQHTILVRILNSNVQYGSLPPTPSKIFLDYGIKVLSLVEDSRNVLRLRVECAIEHLTIVSEVCRRLSSINVQIEILPE